ncbi:hypothetical protein PAMP_014767 [Pampus punctatissimus]
MKLLETLGREQNVCDLCLLKEDVQDVMATQRHMKPGRQSEAMAETNVGKIEKSCLHLIRCQTTIFSLFYWACIGHNLGLIYVVPLLYVSSCQNPDEESSEMYCYTPPCIICDILSQAEYSNGFSNLLTVGATIQTKSIHFIYSFVSI